MDNRQFYIKEFDNNYYYNFKSEYRFFKFIEVYVRTRIFDMKIFKEDMEVIINTIDTEKLPGYKRLLTEEYWKISEEQFPKVIEEVLEDVKNGNLKAIEIVKLYAYFSYFIDKGLIDYDIDTIKNLFFNGMNLAALNSEYCDNVEEELARIGIDEVTQGMEDILKYFYNINTQLKEKMYTTKAENIFKCIPMKMETFYEQFATECMDFPILKYYDVFQLFQRISCASNEDIVTIKELLQNRVIQNREKLLPEVKKLKQLKQIIDDYVANKANTIKIVMLKEFASDLGNIIYSYESEN